MGMGCNFVLVSHSNGTVHFVLGNGMKLKGFRIEVFDHFDLASLLVV